MPIFSTSPRSLGETPSLLLLVYLTTHSFALGQSFTAAPSVGINKDGRLEIFARAGDGGVWHNSQTSIGANWTGWSYLGGNVLDTPSVGMNEDGRLEIFAPGADYATWNNWQTYSGGSWYRWASLGGSITRSPSVGAEYNGSLAIFGQRTDGSVWRNWQTFAGEFWSSWSLLGGNVNGTPSVAANQDGRLEIFARGTDGAAWHTWETTPGGTWSGWSSLGGQISGSPSVGVNADGRLEIFALAGNSAFQNSQLSPGGSWSGWSSISGSVVTTPSVARNSDGTLAIFARGNDGSVWDARQAYPGGAWSSWSSLGGGTIGSPSVEANADGRLEAFALGTNYGVWHDQQTSPGGAWSGWYPLSGSASSIGPPSTSQLRGGSDYIWIYVNSPSLGDTAGVIAHYNDMKASIDAQLQTMFDNGQRRLRLPILHCRGCNNGINLDSTGGNLSLQNRENLAGLLHSIKAIGFEEIEVGFFPLGQNSVSWNSWNEGLYQENWDLIVNLRPIIIAANMPYRLDLENEGIPSTYQSNYAIALRYAQRLWTDYTAAFGKNDTVGFSLIPDPTRTNQVGAVYGNNPPVALDIHIYGSTPYGNVMQTVEGLRADLSSQGLGADSWIIGETYYNYSAGASDLRNAIVSTGQTVLFLCQWPDSS